MLHNLVYINALLDQPVFIMCAHTFFLYFYTAPKLFPSLKKSRTVFQLKNLVLI